MLLIRVNTRRHKVGSQSVWKRFGFPEDDAFLVAVLISTCAVLAGAALAPGLVHLQQALGNEHRILARLVITIPALGVPVGALLFGALLPAAKHKIVLLTMLAVFALTGAAGVIIHAYGPLLVLRFLQGASIGPIMVIAMRLLARGDNPQSNMALQSMVMTGATVGILLIGGVASALAWWLPFLMQLAPLFFIPMVSRLPENVFIPVQRPRQEGLARPQAPLVFNMVVAVCLAFLAMVAFYALPVLIPSYLYGLGFGHPLAAAGMIVVSVIAAAVGSFAFRKFAAIVPRLAVLALAYFAVFSGFMYLTYVSQWPPMVLGVALVGFGFGLIFPVLNHWVTTSDMGIEKTKAIAMVTAAFQMGQFFAPIAGVPAFEHAMDSGAIFLPYGVLAVFGLSLVIFNRAVFDEPRPVPTEVGPVRELEGRAA